MSLLAGHAYVDIEPKLAAGFESKLSSAVGGATKAAGDLGSRNISAGLKNVGASISSVGGKLTKGVTLPLLAGGIAVTKFATDFGRGMGNVATLIPGNTKRVNELSSAVQKMAVETGKSTSDLTGGLYQVISAFGDTADTVSILKINAKAATAGVAETTDAINLTSAVTKAYGDTTATAVQHTADLALNTVRLGQTTFPELAGSIGLVTPLAAALGIKVEDLFGTFATFTGVTGGAAEVSTQLRGVLQSLLAPTADMSSLFKTLGVDSGAALIKQRGLQGAVQAVVDAADKSGKPLQAYLSSIEAQTLALAGSAGQHDAWIQKNKEMAHVTGQTDKAFEALTTGIGKNTFQLDQAKAAAEVAAIKIGNALAPAVGIALRGFVPLASGIADTASALLTMEGPGGTAVRILGGIAIAAGPVLYVTGKLISGIGSLADTFKTIKGGVDAFRVGLKGIETSIGGGLPNKIGVLVSNLGLLGAAGVVGVTTALAAGFYGMSKAIASADRETAHLADTLIHGGADLDEVTRKLNNLGREAGLPDSAAKSLQRYTDELLAGKNATLDFDSGVHRNAQGQVVLTGVMSLAQTKLQAVADKVRDLTRQYGAAAVQTATLSAAQKQYADFLASGSRDEDRRTALRERVIGASTRQAKVENEVNSATREGADAAADLAGQMGDQAGATTDAASALDTYKTAVDNVLGVNLDAISAGLAYADAVDGLTAKIKANGGSLDENTAKGRVNAETLVETTNKARSYAEALVQQKGDTAGATAVLVGHASQLLAVAHQAGLTGQAAVDYTTRLLGIPHDAATNIHNSADIAAYFVALYKGKLDQIPPDKHTNITVDLIDHATNAFESMLGRFQREAAIGVEARVNTFGRPHAHGGIERATPGGVLVKVAEAGEDEAILPLGTSMTARKDRARILKQIAPFLDVPAAASGGIYQSGSQVGTSPYQSGSRTSNGLAEDDVLVVNSRGQVVPMWALKKGEHWTPLLNSGSRVGSNAGGRSLGPPRTHRQVPSSSRRGATSTSADVDPTVAILRRIEKVLVRSEHALEEIAAKDTTLSINGKALAVATAKDTATALRRLEKARS